MNYLKAVGVACCIIVLNQYINMQWWEAGFLSFGLATLLIN